MCCFTASGRGAGPRTCAHGRGRALAQSCAILPVGGAWGLPPDVLDAHPGPPTQVTCVRREPRGPLAGRTHVCAPQRLPYSDLEVILRFLVTGLHVVGEATWSWTCPPCAHRRFWTSASKSSNRGQRQPGGRVTFTGTLKGPESRCACALWLGSCRGDEFALFPSGPQLTAKLRGRESPLSPLLVAPGLEAGRRLSRAALSCGHGAEWPLFALLPWVLAVLYHFVSSTFVFNELRF